MARIIGERYRFDYPQQFTTLPAYTAHAGQMVTVLRELGEDEYENLGEMMYVVRAEDGWEGHAWEGELIGGSISDADQLPPELREDTPSLGLPGWETER